jgi:hypothetical protein
MCTLDFLTPVLTALFLEPGATPLSPSDISNLDSR